MRSLESVMLCLVEENVLEKSEKVLMIKEVRDGRNELSMNIRHGQRAE